MQHGAIDPSTLRSTSFPLPACGDYVTVANDLVYIAGALPAGDPGRNAFHLEVFNPASKHATLMSPIITTTVGSDRAHMDMTYQDGSIWMSEWGSSLWQISPATGKVVRTITDAPASIGGHGIIVGNRGGLWMTPGPGSRAALYRLAPGARTISRVYIGPKDSTLLWLATAGNTVWASVADTAPNGVITTTSLTAFDLGGRQVLTAGNQQFGDIPLVGTPSETWSVGSGAECAAPQHLWYINPATGRSTALTTLATPVEPCLTENPTSSQMAMVGDTLLVLEPTGADSPPAVLYRIQTRSRSA